MRCLFCLQREWRKIWADVYSKNIHKALDYQGIVFKLNDKKNTGQKTLVQEAEILYQEQKEREGDGVANKLSFQYEAFFKDSSIFDDILRLVNFYLEKTSSGFSNPEKERIFSAVYDVVLPFLFLERQKPKTKVGTTTPPQPNGSTTAPASNGEKGAEAESSDSTAKKVDAMDVDSTPAVAESSTASQEKSLPPWARQNVMFANGSLFTLIRLFQASVPVLFLFLFLECSHMCPL